MEGRSPLERCGLLGSGFRKSSAEAVLDVVDEAGKFLPRPKAEADPSWKQIIPYAVVRCGAAYFLMKRLRRGGEPRLYDRYSVGVGGHINPTEGTGAEAVEAGLLRELNEELVLDGPLHQVSVLGTLNDDSNSVGQVHFGLVYLIETASVDVYVRETEVLEGRFVDADGLRARTENMETWSRFVVEALFEGERSSALRVTGDRS